MAEIAVVLATKQAEGLINKLGDKLFLFFRVRTDVLFIKEELEVMMAFLIEAEKEKNNESSAKVWVKQLKELAYKIEDCIEEFSLHLPCRSSNSNLAASLWHRVCSVGSLPARCRIAADIRNIKSKVKELSDRRLRYGISERAASTDRDDVAQYDSRSSALFVDESRLVGIDEPRKKLVEWLLDESESQLSSIGVVGAGGLGKTTIVNKALEDPKVAGGHFQCCARITVSQVYNTNSLLRSMIKQLFSPAPKDEELDKLTEWAELVQMLRVHLKDKRYAIVFDDIWEIDAWNGLEASILQHNQLGSRIIITTRKQDVADYCAYRIPGNIHHQEKLKEEDSWELFCKRVFPEQQTCPENLKKLSQNILKKCDGNPLAIISIAATLATKPNKTIKEWDSFLKHFCSELESNPHLQGATKILNFSYTDLPYHVQRCFLYLSRFPEDSVIDCERIKTLWVAEGLISALRDRSAEETAELNLNMLINRNMIIPSNISPLGEVWNFTIHDIMMEMIVSISVEEDFVSRIPKDSPWRPKGVIRRLLVDSGSIPDDVDLSYVRSLFLSGDSVPSSLFVSPAFKMLRVLDLDDCRYFNNNHFDGVCQLLHLKYFSMRNKRFITIPKSIGRLRNLETFDIQGCYGKIRDIEIPVEIEKLKRLQLLRGQFLTVPTKLNLWKLTALQELGMLKIEHVTGEKLQNLYHLRKLDVWFEDYPNRGAYFFDSLKTMSSSLRSLQVTSINHLNFLNVDLESPLLGLESLNLNGSLDALPNWVSSLTNLTKLFLINTFLGADAIQALGRLPKLIQLRLHWRAYNEERLCFSAESFKSLKFLDVNYMPPGSILVFEIGSMPCLETVQLNGSYRGDRFLQISGVENLIGLKMIRLYGCEVGVVNSVKQAVQAHPNHPQLII